MAPATQANVFDNVMGNLLGLDKDSPIMRALCHQGYDSVNAMLSLSPSKVNEYYDFDDSTKEKIIVPDYHKSLVVGIPVFWEYRA